MPSGEYTNIMVAIDGSKTSELAYKKAVNIALRNKGKLFVTHIIDTRALNQFYPTPDSPRSTSDFVSAQSSAAENTLNRFNDWGREQGLTDIEVILKRGSPRTELADVLPQEYNIDLLIMGATGLSAIERAFVGSVSQYVVRNAPCDVLIIRLDGNTLDTDPIIK